MFLRRPNTLEDLAPYLPRFLALVGRERWVKRADELDAEQRRSPYRWKIVADYHWLELAISHQCDILAKEGRLLAEHADMQAWAGLHFVATIVEVHDGLSAKGKKSLAGRLRDALKAETGFAALYLEMDIAQRLTIDGFELEFPDLDGTGQYDLAFSGDTVDGEVECKSISVDAGRKIHRKDFYRFIDAMTPSFSLPIEQSRSEVLLIDLANRLTANLREQGPLRSALERMLIDGAAKDVESPTFTVTRLTLDRRLRRKLLTDQARMSAICKKRWGQNCHAAGLIMEDRGCLVVMRSGKEDDTSKPLLLAMRKAASQFSGKRPSFIAVQFDDLAPADLLLAHLRRRTGILSTALFHYYGADHVNATCFSCFDGLVRYGGNASSPSFAVPNLNPQFPLGATDIPSFLRRIPDPIFADIIGAPLPASDISTIHFDASASN